MCLLHYFYTVNCNITFSSAPNTKVDVDSLNIFYSSIRGKSSPLYMMKMYRGSMFDEAINIFEDALRHFSKTIFDVTKMLKV